ncbi:hypothetical protein ABZ832_07765 [Streptantibioticus parmotrematis]|uniref:hypothetical protein n=1 Tax=Streptantibioticus parmotrematis TaxID=2873249 RepID=UPI0033C8C270
MKATVRRTAGGVVAGVLGAVALGVVTAGTAAADDGFADDTVVCSGGVANVCAHLQYAGTGGDLSSTQVRGQGTAASGQQVTIDSVTLNETVVIWMGPPTTTQVATTDQSTTAGGQVTGTTAAAQRQYGFGHSSVSYTVTVTYQVNGGPTATVNATAPSYLPVG